MSARLAAFLYRFRFPLSAAIVSGAVALLPRVDITTIDNDITAWFSREDPVYREYERFRREFGGTRQLIVALEVRDPAGGDVFTRERLEAVDAISAAIERIPTVERVHSLATATVVSALDDGEGIDVRPLADYLDRGGPARVRALAMGDELVRGDLVSEDGRVAAILVGFDEDRVDAVRAQVLEAVRRAVESRLPPGLVAHYNGSIEISETYNRVTLANQRQFTPPILLVTLAALWAMFRSWRKTLLVLVAIVVSLAWTLGLYSLAGFSYNVLSSMLVPLIVVLAIADDVHIVQHFERERRHAGPREAFEHTVASLAAPIAGASGTTALGMLSLATSDIVAVRTFGIGAAVGVMVDCALSLVLVPTLLTLVPPDARAAPHERRLVEPLRQAARATAARWRIVLVAAAIVTAIAGAGIARLRVETNHISFFADRHPLHVSADLIDRELAGVYGFNIMLEGPPGSLASPDALRRMDRLAASLRQLPYVRKVGSLATYVRRIDGALRGEAGRAAADGEGGSVPEDPRLVAQELFVFTLADEGRAELARMAASDYSHAQIWVKLNSMSSDLVFEHIARAEALARDAFAGTPIRTTVTGSGRLFSTLDHYLVTSQLSSFGTAFVTVFGVIFVLFRSLRYGLLAIVPNLVPVVVVLGAMGWLDISMNVATVMVASVALGVVDDDTIHFISRFRREVEAGAPVETAIEAATVHEARAALTTALINSAGFAVLLLSEYKPTAWFGGLLAATMATAFLAEVFVLPATIMALPVSWWAPRRGASR